MNPQKAMRGRSPKATPAHHAVAGVEPGLSLWGVLRPGPVLAAAEQPAEDTAFDAQHVGFLQRYVRRVGLAVLGVVDLPFPAVAPGGLHIDQDRQSEQRAVALAGFG